MHNRSMKGLLGLLGLAAMVIAPWAVQAGSLEPSAPPAPTTQIPPAWSQILPDADRFEVVMGGAAVLDKETGLVWDQSPETVTRPWNDGPGGVEGAQRRCNIRLVGGRMGWRLPTVHELASLVDPNNPGGNPDLPAGHPFDPAAVQSSTYWSAATNSWPVLGEAWVVRFSDGAIGTNPKDTLFHVWCVRGGHGFDAY